ncbi:unknown [Clostridium sp. CAG:306]|nr:unknown [Clostridium sp. CAG:306]
MGWFSKKMNIGEGKKYDVSQISKDGVTQEEAVKNNKKLINVFKAFNFQGGEKLEDIELASAMDAFEKIDSQFGNKDGKLSKAELEKGAAWLNKELGLTGDDAIDRKDLKEFIKNIRQATKNDTKVSTDKVISDWQREQTEAAMKKEQPAAPEPETPAPEQKEVEKPKEKPAELYNYVVQADESFTDVIKKSLQAQGKELTSENIQAAKEQFKKDNEGAVKTAKNGIEYLLVGAKVKLPGNVESPKDAASAIAEWSEKHADLVWKPKAPATEEVSQEEEPPAASDEAAESPETVAAEEEKQDVPKDKEGAIKAMGLRETFASKSKGIYVDPKTNQHYKWNPGANEFIALDKNVAMVGKDGANYNKDGKYLHSNSFRLLTDGRDVYTKDDGSTETSTYNDDGKCTKRVEKDKDGNLLSIMNYTYSAEGIKNGCKRIDYYSDKKMKKVTDFSYDTSGKETDSLTRYYSPDGKLENINQFTNGKNGSYIGQEVDASGNPIGEPWYMNADNEEITKEEYDKLQE